MFVPEQEPNQRCPSRIYWFCGFVADPVEVMSGACHFFIPDGRLSRFIPSPKQVDSPIPTSFVEQLVHSIDSYCTYKTNVAVSMLLSYDT